MDTFLVSLPSGERIFVSKEKTLIGRNKSSDIMLPDVMVSRRHCMIYRKGLAYYLTDLDSTNGTYLNGSRITGTIRLKNNDTISIGRESQAYQFRSEIADFNKIIEFSKKPFVFIPLIASGVVLICLFVWLLFFANSGKIDIKGGISRFREIYGESSLPEDPAFYSALKRTVLSIRNDPGFEEARKRRLKYRDLIERILSEQKLPLEFSFIPWVESGYNPLAINSISQAGGMWQLIPPTARAYGLRVDNTVDERLDPVKSTRAAAACLADQVAVFGSNAFLLILAAYNAGDNAVLYGLKQIDDPVADRNFWYLNKRNLIPAETKKYVLFVLGHIIVELERESKTQ